MTPEIKDLVCVGIAEATSEAINENPLLKGIVVAEPLPRPYGYAHDVTAVTFINEGTTYTYDWWQTLDPNDPVIMPYDVWVRGGPEAVQREEFLRSHIAMLHFQYPADDYGGVSLSKTADLMLNISDIEGAFFDEKTGQIIFYGKQDITLPPLDLDDLAVAIRSIYGFGDQMPQDPGVSIDPSDIPGQSKVRYIGQTIHTNFGWVMFESDRMVKCLSVGIDNITGEPLTCDVEGYMTMPDRYILAGGLPADKVYDRMWFVPKQITLIESDEGTSMIFDKAEMALLTESTFQSNIIDNPVAEEYTEHFTQHYDEFADEFPILRELKRLAKIAAIVKWFRENDIPFDLYSFYENYIPEFDPRTPEYTPEITVSVPYSGGIITSTGGVSYRLDESNFSTATDPLADQIKQDAIAHRQQETDFMWDFQTQDPNGDSEQYTAIAHSFIRTKKAGSVSRAETDMRFPVLGDNPLALVRYYSSFNDKPTCFGYGWRMIPYQLRFTDDKKSFTVGDDPTLGEAYDQIYVTEENQEYLYTLFSLDNDNNLLYARNGGQYYLKDMRDGTFTLFKKNLGTITFNGEGKVIRITDKNGISIDYNYENSKLVSISHQGGRAITIGYNEDDQIISATGPSSKVVTYAYDENGNLSQVTNQENETFTYLYDSDRRLTRIIDPRGNTTFDAAYDAYNREVFLSDGGEAFSTKNFSLADSMSTETNANGVTIQKKYDADYRLIQQVDSLGNRIDISYINEFGPATITDPMRNTTEYKYDAMGNVCYIKDAENGENRYFHDGKNNLIAKRDACEHDTAFVYDTMDRLIEIRHEVELNLNEDHQMTNYTYDPTNITPFTYDPANGNLLTIKDPEGHILSHTYDENGMPLESQRANGYEVLRTYDERSRLIAVSNAGGEYILYGYDNADRITSVTTAAGTISYTYDKNGNIDIIYDAKNNPTDYEYDENNNLIQVTDAENQTTQYEYDKHNNLIKIILPNGATREIQYDKLNRPISEKVCIFRPNEPPLALDDSYNTTEDNALTVEAPGILINDCDLEEDLLTAMLVNNPEHGILSLNPDGSFTYVPNIDFNGIDSFTYKANDGKSESNTATVTISVNVENPDPLSYEMKLPQGWSMISLPLIPENTPVSSLFPGAVVVYRYQKGAGYVRVQAGESLEVGMGYWILLNNPQTYVITGTAITEYTMPAADGWYMIGGCTDLAQTMVTTGSIDVIYEYTQGCGYTRVPGLGQLEQGKGYWILFSNTSGGASFTANTSAK